MSVVLADGKSAERKKKKGQCQVVGCTSPTRNGRIACNKHEHEIKKNKNPYIYWYGVLRRNARRRKKEFTISLEYFIQFCNETGYMDTKGKKSGSMTIDRKDDNLGYVEGNLQVLEVGCNSRKRFTDYELKRNTQTYETPPIDTSDIEKPKLEDTQETDVPF